MPSQKVLFSGDLVEYEAGIYTGDAHLEEWPATLEKLRFLKPRFLVPGRAPALTAPAACDRAIAYTQDEASGIKHPRIWTARRDIEMWKSIA